MQNMSRIIIIFSLFISCLNSMVIDDTITDDSIIISKSKNFTVHANETIQLPCLVHKTPQTIVIWNQCEDSNCNQIRNLLIVNKENFVDDLRFRVLNENSIESDSNKPVHESWNLEIRKFGKNDEACYQCQLNSFKAKTIHYCLKLQTKVTAKPTKVSVYLNEPLKLQCYSDENVRLHNIQWYKHKEKLADDSENHKIDRKNINQNQAYTSLSIKKTTLDDAGVYFCRFGHYHDKIHVEIISDGLNLKASAIELNKKQEDASNSFLTMSPSLANTIFSFTKFSIVFYIYLLLIIIFSVFNKYTID